VSRRPEDLIVILVKVAFQSAANARSSIVHLDQEFGIDPVELVRSLDTDDCRELLEAVALVMDGSEVVDAFEDQSAVATKYEGRDVLPLTSRGTVLMDCFVERARQLGRLPGDYVSEAMMEFASDIDRLHEAICDGRTDDACALLRQMAPDHDFMSDAARIMLARGRVQEALL
jgi:hypothetical protein